MTTRFTLTRIFLPILSLTLSAAKPADKAAIRSNSAPQKPGPQRSLPITQWHTWSDKEGRSVYAELLSRDGDHVCVRTEQGQTYRLNLTKLVPSDRVFAESAERLLPGEVVSVEKAAGRVDALVNSGLQKAGLTANPPLSEEQFVRRLYLDVAGRIPTEKELLAYLADPSTDKRPKLIDSLLASEGYNSQLFDWLADTLRLKDDFGKGVKSYVYQEWIKDQIKANRHWDTLVYEMMTAEGRITSNGAAGYLLRDRGMPLDNLSNTLTTFLGANVACAQCHDHPSAAWSQRNFYEMAAFFGATEQGYTKQNAKQIGGKRVIDKTMLKRLVLPNLAVVETLAENKLTFPKDYKYDDAKPGQPVLPKLIAWTKEDERNPAYAGAGSGEPAKWRDQFAVWLTHPDNPRFAAAISNRIWKKLFGLGVQEPVTDLDNPKDAVNPQLLNHLASEMKRVRFDLREFQRIILNTAAYQAQASPQPKSDSGPYLFPGPLLRRMSSDQVWDSILTLVVGPEIDRFKLHRADEMRRVDIQAPQLTAAAITAKAAELKADSGPRKGVGKKNTGKVSPEEFEGPRPPMFEGITLARSSELPQPSIESHLLRNFGQSDRDVADTNSTEGGVPQVLLMMNGALQKAVTSPTSLVMSEAMKRPGTDTQILYLFHSFLGRPPTTEQMGATREMLEGGLKLKDLAWVFLNTREFIFIQ